MKYRTMLLCLGVLLAVSSRVTAAPVESSASRRSVALQKVDAYLQEQAVAKQLAALGLTQTEVRARVATLSDARLAEVAGQVDLLRAGGTIQGGNPHPFGVLECIFKPVGRFFYNLYQVVFCWGAHNID